jgi:hypothetical protein
MEKKNRGGDGGLKINPERLTFYDQEVNSLATREKSQANRKENGEMVPLDP